MVDNSINCLTHTVTSGMTQSVEIVALSDVDWRVGRYRLEGREGIS